MAVVTFSQYAFRTENRDGKSFIFDELRKKFVVLSPEEWVRQHVIHYLVHDRKYPRSLIAVERGIVFNGVKRRFDVVVFGQKSEPKMIIECKAPEEKLDERVFEQIARYNLSLNVDYLWVTNGAANYLCRIQNGIEWMEEVPGYQEL